MMENWLLPVVCVYLVGMILYGHHKGFIRLSVSMVGLVASLVIVNMAMPYVTGFIKDNHVIYDMVQDRVKEATGIGADRDTENSSEQRLLIEDLDLPEQFKEALVENNNNEVYDLLGVDKFVDYVVGYLTERIVHTVGFLIMFLIVLGLIHFLMRWLDIVARLPIIYGINKVAGAALGGLEALIVLWILCIVVTIFSSSEMGRMIMAQISSSKMLTYLYQNNLLGFLFANIVTGFL